MKNVKLKFKSKQKKRILATSALILIGVVLVVFFMSHMQHEYSLRKANQAATSALETVIDSLNSNTEKVETLQKRYHNDNNAVLSDMTYLLKTPYYSSLLTENDTTERSRVMQKLSSAIGSSGYLFVIDADGKIVMAPQENYVGANLIDNGTLSKEQFGNLISDSDVTVTAYLPGTDILTSFYSKNLVDGYYLIYAMELRELEMQFEAMRALEPVLSSVVVGDNGFVFAVDSSTGKFMYFNDGSTRLDGMDYSTCGLTEAVLSDNYAGIETINGTEYQCLSKTYSSPFYGEYTVITAVCAADSVFKNDISAIGLTAIAFFISSIVILLYASLLQLDPDQLATYDDKIYNSREAHKYRHRKEASNIRNISMFKFKGDQVYLKLGIAEKLAPIVAISMILVFAISWNSQTLIEISKGINLSQTAISQLEALFSNRDNSSEIIMNRYQGQYLSKLKLMSFILEEDPSLLELVNTGTEEDGVHTYIDDSFNELKDEYGRPVKSIANSQLLKNIAANNSFDYLGIFDSQGRVIAVNVNEWFFTLSRNKGDQSNAFTDVITGKCDSLIQEPGDDEFGARMQYIGTVFYYYTLAGNGPEAGKFVSINEYNDYLEKGYYKYEDSRYEVKKNRGLIQGGISDTTILSIMESTSNNALMNQIKVGSDGFMVLFDNSPEHVCVWSKYPASIGHSAADLNISDASFSGTFKGFNRVNGVKYFQMYTFDNGYWIATAIPTNSIFAGRNPIAAITTLVSAAFFILLFLISIFSTEDEEKMLEEIFEKNISNKKDNGMVKVMMPSGKMKYVRSAAARYTGSNLLWEDMTTDQKLSKVLKIAVSVVVVCLLITGIFSDRLFGEDSAFSYIVRGDWEHSFNYFAVVAFTSMVLCVSVISFIVSRFINFIIRNMGSRVETIGRLLLSVIKYGAVLFAIFYGLSLLGFSTAGLVTSAGIMSIVVGLGAQSLIGDILSGIFIVFEGAFRVGDIVTVGDFRGNVVEIGLRTTKIENTAGDIKIFNNSSIVGIINMTKKSSKALCDVSIEYSADLELVEKILSEALKKIGDKNDKIIGTPVYLGVVELGDSAVVIRIIADCAEKDRLAVQRYLNREIFLLFKKNNVNIPFPQITVSYMESDGDKEE